MISINNKSTFKTLSSYLSAYRILFYKRSFNNFVRIICAMLCLQEVQSIKFIYEKFISKYWTIALNNYQVIVLCDSWYTKKPFVQRVKVFSNVDIIGALRSDTVMYDLKPQSTGKKVVQPNMVIA